MKNINIIGYRCPNVVCGIIFMPTEMGDKVSIPEHRVGNDSESEICRGSFQTAIELTQAPVVRQRTSIFVF